MKHFLQILRAAGTAFVGTALAAVLLVSCSGMLDTPEQKASTGTVVIRIGDGAARTILPKAEAPAFTRYELTLTKDSLQTSVDIPSTDLTDISGAGVEVELANGDWTAVVKAYRKITGYTPEYLAAQGTSAPITIAAGASVLASIKLTPVPLDDPALVGLKGVFSWNITVPAGVTSAELSLAPSNETTDSTKINLRTDSSGKLEIKAGTYNLSFTFKKGDLTAGFYEWVYIYPGFESLASLDFNSGKDKLIFGNQVLLQGTAAINDPERLSREDDLTVTAWDVLKNVQIGSSQKVAGGKWLLDIPVTDEGPIGRSVSLKLEAKNYPGLIAEKQFTLSKTGKADITLELNFVKGTQAITGVDVLQIGESPITATINGAGTRSWSIRGTGTTTIDSATGVVTLPADDTEHTGVLLETATITCSITNGDTVTVVSKENVKVYGKATTLIPTYDPLAAPVGTTSLPSNKVAIEASSGTAHFTVESTNSTPIGEIVTINSNTGELTLVGNGTVKVSLTITSTDDVITYKGTSSDITVTVRPLSLLSTKTSTSKNGITASLAFVQAGSPITNAIAGTSVRAKVSLNGAATAAKVMTFTISSSKAKVTASVATGSKYIRAGATAPSSSWYFSFTMPDVAVDDFVVTLEESGLTELTKTQVVNSDQLSTFIAANCVGGTTANPKRLVFAGEAFTSVNLGAVIAAVNAASTYVILDLGGITVSGSATADEIATLLNTDSSITGKDRVKGLVLPSSLTSIGDYVFEKCDHLTEITLPSSLTSIGNLVFFKCSALASVTLEATSPPELGNRAFEDTATDLMIHVPFANIATYKAATEWSTYADRIE